MDYRPDAPADEWSGDIGCGAEYFSQQAVGRLLHPAGIKLPDELDLPEKLLEVQSLMAKEDPRARSIYETIGTYLGYSLAHYSVFMPWKMYCCLDVSQVAMEAPLFLKKQLKC